MSSLAQVLERFNRKERNLLVRAILGHEEKPLRLSPRFRQQVGDELGFPIPEDAWWATDYHISWLAGALAIFITDGDGLQKSYENRAVNKRKLVEGNQEDIDLVIATDQHLILIEAKAHGAWDNAQLRSKLARLSLLHEFCKTLELVPQRALCFHLLLVSPVPVRLTPTPTRAGDGYQTGHGNPPERRFGFPQSVPEFHELFPYDAAYAAYLDRARWPVGFVWPYCGQIALHVDASYI